MSNKIIGKILKEDPTAILVNEISQLNNAGVLDLKNTSPYFSTPIIPPNNVTTMTSEIMIVFDCLLTVAATKTVVFQPQIITNLISNLTFSQSDIVSYNVAAVNSFSIPHMINYQRCLTYDLEKMNLLSYITDSAFISFNSGYNNDLTYAQYAANPGRCFKEGQNNFQVVLPLKDIMPVVETLFGTGAMNLKMNFNQLNKVNLSGNLTDDITEFKINKIDAYQTFIKQETQIPREFIRSPPGVILFNSGVDFTATITPGQQVNMYVSIPTTVSQGTIYKCLVTGIITDVQGGVSYIWKDPYSRTNQTIALKSQEFLPMGTSGSLAPCFSFANQKIRIGNGEIYPVNNVQLYKGNYTNDIQNYLYSVIQSISPMTDGTGSNSSLPFDSFRDYFKFISFDCVTATRNNPKGSMPFINFNIVSDSTFTVGGTVKFQFNYIFYYDATQQ